MPALQAGHRLCPWAPFPAFPPRADKVKPALFEEGKCFMVNKFSELKPQE